MRVLHIIDALGVGGGAEHSLVSLLPALDERGVESSVLCLVPREGGLQARVAAEGYPIEVVEPQGWVGRVRAVRRHVAATRPDLVHATLGTSCLVSRVALVGQDVPLVNSVVNTSYVTSRTAVTPWKMRLVRPADGVTARRVDRFHAITDTVAEETARDLGIDRDLITVIPRGRAIARDDPAGPSRRERARRDLDLDDDTPVVVTVGRQDHQKGQVDLVRAFARVVERQPDALLLLVGRPGAASDEIHEALEATDLARSVVLLGHRDDAVDVMAAGDVFAFPSRYEGLGCVLIEAMAVGVPVVGSDAEAIVEVLDDGRAGVVVPRGRSDLLADALTGLLDAPEERRRLAAVGRERYETAYELGTVADRTVRLYEDVLTSEQRRPTRRRRRARGTRSETKEHP